MNDNIAVTGTSETLADVRKKASLTLTFTSTDDGRATVLLTTAPLAMEAAQHLVDHLQDAMEAFVKCIGGVGKKYVGTTDKDTGKEKLLLAEDFGSEPIDPKKVN